MLDGKTLEFQFGKIKFLIGGHLLNYEEFGIFFRMETFSDVTGP